MWNRYAPLADLLRDRTIADKGFLWLESLTQLE